MKCLNGSKCTKIDKVICKSQDKISIEMEDRFGLGIRGTKN